MFKKLVLLLFLMVTCLLAQNYNYYYEKSGSCPPALTVPVCSRSCYVDSNCQDDEKCCPTGCGGSFCSQPVTMKKKSQIEKRGSCPTVPAGRWICSPTCTNDSDCRGVKKCCVNRCGALNCQVPEVKAAELSY